MLMNVIKKYNVVGWCFFLNNVLYCMDIKKNIRLYID